MSDEFPEYTTTFFSLSFNTSKAFWASGECFALLFKFAVIFSLGVDVLVADPKKFNPFTEEITGSIDSESDSQKPCNWSIAILDLSPSGLFKNPLP